MLTNFINPFAAAYPDELPKENKQDLPPHLKLNLQLCNFTARECDVIQCKCDAKSFIFDVCLLEMFYMSKQINLQYRNM